MKQKYKILLTISEFMYSSQVRNLCDLVSGLDKDIFDIEIGSLAVGDEATPEIEALGVPFYLLRTHPPRSLNAAWVKDFLKSPFIVRKKQFDLVHSLLYQSLCTEPLIIKALSSAKYVYTKSNHGWENHRFNWTWKSRLADRIISISRSTDEILARHGFKDKIAKIFLGIDINHFRESAEKREKLRASRQMLPQTLVFGCAAQFLEWKNQMTLIDAFEKLCRRHDDIVLFFCGPHHNDDYYRTITSRIAGSPFKDRIHLLGTLEDMPAFYSAIDCFILPSRNEPFGYVYVEAMSCNKPVIASRAGGPLDIIEEGDNGYFVETYNADDLADKMEIYIKDRSSIFEHGKSGRNRVEKLFSTEVMVRNHQNLFLEMLQGTEAK